MSDKKLEVAAIGLLLLFAVLGWSGLILNGNSRERWKAAYHAKQDEVEACAKLRTCPLCKGSFTWHGYTRRTEPKPPPPPVKTDSEWYNLYSQTYDDYAEFAHARKCDKCGTVSGKLLYPKVQYGGTKPEGGE